MVTNRARPQRKRGDGQKYCFVVSPIGEVGSETRRRSDGIFREIIVPALAPLGYRVERADHDKSPGIVTESMISKVLQADLVVADLSGHNPNVMYEVALRHAAGRSIVQMIEEGENLPFDIQGINTVFFRPTLEGLQEAISALNAAANAATADVNTGNPVVRTVQFIALQSTNTPESELLTSALTEIRELASRINTEASLQQYQNRSLNTETVSQRRIRAILERFVDSDPKISNFRNQFPVADLYVFFAEAFVFLIIQCFDEEQIYYAAAGTAEENFFPSGDLDGTLSYLRIQLLNSFEGYRRARETERD